MITKRILYQLLQLAGKTRAKRTELSALRLARFTSSRDLLGTSSFPSSAGCLINTSQHCGAALTFSSHAAL